VVRKFQLSFYVLLVQQALSFEYSTINRIKYKKRLLLIPLDAQLFRKVGAHHPQMTLCPHSLAIDLLRD